MSVDGIYLPYLEARDFVRSKKIKNSKEWRVFCKVGKKPLNIPSHPHKIYKNSGWVSWMEWLGTYNGPSGNRRHTVNDDYFKKWSSNMAYILGFWFADGHMGKYKGSYVFGISQHKEDKYLLEKILKDMGSDYQLSYDRKHSCYFKIASKTIYDNIIKLGGKERKSLDVKFPYVPKKYLPDFIRGLWDGDGSVYYAKYKGHKTYRSTYVSASKDFLDTLYKVLKENIPHMSGHIQHYKKYHLINFSINDTVKLKKFIYSKYIENKLFLERKYQRFLEAEALAISRHRSFLDYKFAQKIIGRKGFAGWKEWESYCKSGSRPLNVPSNPHIFYKNKGWISWPKWFGYPRKIKWPTKTLKQNHKTH